MNRNIVLVFALIMMGNGVGVFASPDGFIETQFYHDTFDMVIIAPDIFFTELQPLIEHKNSVGVDTFLKTTEEIYN